MRLFGRFASPNDKFSAISEIAARNVWWWICFCPCDYIENLKSQVSQAIGHRKDIVIGATDPYCPIIFQLLTAQCYPLTVKFPNLLWRTALIPITFIHTNYFPCLVADTIIR